MKTFKELILKLISRKAVFSAVILLYALAALCLLCNKVLGAAALAAATVYLVIMLIILWYDRKKMTFA